MRDFVLTPEMVAADATRLLAEQNEVLARYLASLPTEQERFDAILQALNSKDRVARSLAGTPEDQHRRAG